MSSVAGLSPQHMRRANERAVFDLLRSGTATDVPALAAGTGLSRPTVSAALSRLEEARLVRRDGARGGVVGRAATLWTVDERAGVTACVDLGRSTTRVAVTDLRGGRLAERTGRTRRRSARSVVEQASEMVGAALAEAGADRGDVLATLVSSPGVFDAQARRMMLAPNLPGWEYGRAVDLLQQHFGDDLALENDVDLAALGELQARGGQDADFVLLSLGDGVGMGLVLGGALRRGAHGRAGEAAFVPVSGAGTPLDEATRHRGELEATVGVEPFLAAARAAGLPARDPGEVVRAAGAGDPAAEELLARTAEVVAHALVGVVSVVDPGLVVVGGDLGLAGGALLLERVEAALRARLPFTVPRLELSRAGAGATLAGAVGHAVDLAWERAFERLP
ncbi:putative NBD/HSP70 family sugar kinase [Motilibacter rhizosphaerae]|uniref:Putative NBD/HSP70 family sugar kinase n=1 Tax=Motilibacter rhizosphaerae TaxID=598652 RepID=A0A4Q7NWL5_9ACTN|nr:ROK family transcriptional regulator [Motilibacter rhizosphaerae]RZS90802.1 putative NBD/HSP70 family sugar kinase [Motilibacter rhizosphaerae]